MCWGLDTCTAVKTGKAGSTVVAAQDVAVKTSTTATGDNHWLTIANYKRTASTAGATVAISAFLSDQNVENITGIDNESA
jgi:hypothetical protein